MWNSSSLYSEEAFFQHSRKMAHTLALRFLSLVILFFMNSHNIDARDMKTELPEKKQVDSNGGTPESTQPNYAASYTNTIVMKHNHPSHQEKLNEPYITGYKTGIHDSKSKKPYIIGYRTIGTHEASSQPDDYITGYSGASMHDSKSNEPYITSNRNKPAHEANQHDYITEYRTNTHDSSEPYITKYCGTGAQCPKMSISAQDSTKPHEKQYGLHPKKDLTTQDSSQAYLTEYNGPKKSPHHDTEMYTQAYQAAYKKKPENAYGGVGPNDSPEDEIEGYVGYPAAYKKKQENDYGGVGPKDSPEDEIEGYVGYPAAYKKKPENGYDAAKHFLLNRKSGKDLEDSEGLPSSKVDHTEAFKSGFFALDDLFVGNTMTLKFPVQQISPFLPKKEADSIPLSTSQLPSVLELFSISQDSSQAKSMRGTLDQCEGEPITGETKICATSLESMLQFVDTVIGSETKRNIFTTSHPTASGIPMQKYTILEVHDINAPKWVACHPLPYPYAIYYCHFIATGSKVFKVSLGGENGATIEALGICHLDTSDWYPGHIIFKQLGFMPGKNAPVCHFFPVKHLMWVPHPSKATV